MSLVDHHCHCRWTPCTLLLLACCFSAFASEGSPRAHAEAGPMGGSGAAVLEPVPEPKPPATLHRLVFSCVAPGLVTFSDRPCGPLPVMHEIKLLPPAPVRAGESPSVRAPKESASTRVVRADERREAAQRTAAEAQARAKVSEHARTCERLQEAVQTLDRRMRAGYSSAEAPRLWDRWRDAREKLRQADC